MRKSKREAKPKKRKRLRGANSRSPRSYNRGYDTGFNPGYDQGIGEGRQAFHQVLDATSIIIPTRNQVGLLRQCIESIRKYTPEPHEIIVIDNGSTDGTDRYLRSQAGSLRYRIEREGIGFARAVNQGLRMSRGSTVLFLNNDSVVTARWLSNLLGCLRSDPARRLVGPVTNYISGEQQIDVPYRNLNDMQRFAEQYNRQDPARWEQVDRLTGFCVLMTRETMQRIGFLDEGYRVGNYEDDDFGLRARMLGMQLWIAKDCFIHHVGSVSMNELGEEGLRAVNDHNAAYHTAKWARAEDVIERVKQMTGTAVISCAQLLPTHLLVRGAGHTLYWLEGGSRYLVPYTEGDYPRISMMTLKQLAYGGAWSSEILNTRLRELEHASETMHQGGIVITPAGAVGQYDGVSLRYFASSMALSGWGLQHRPRLQIPEVRWSELREGLHIPAPDKIVADNL